MNRTPEQPFAVVKKIHDFLVNHGRVQMVYATAEFQPYSSAFKPDILFRPSSGDYNGRLIFMEFTKFFELQNVRSIREYFLGRVAFVESYVEQSVDLYVLFTIFEFDELSQLSLRKARVLTIPYTEDPEKALSSLASIGVLDS